MVDPQCCYKKVKVLVGVDTLWQVAVDEINERRDNSKITRPYTEEVFYAYYFLLFTFRNPHQGLRKVNRISYSLEVLTNLLFRLEKALDQDKALWGIDIYYFYKSFIKGLLLIGVARFKQDEKLISQKFKDSNSNENVDIIKNMLKEDKAKNKDILDSISRLEAAIIVAKGPTKLTERELRFEREKIKQEESKPKELVV